MSQAVLITTLVDWLNDKLGLHPGQCGVELPPGIPPPMAPSTNLTLVVGMTVMESPDNDTFVNEVYTVDVHVNKRTNVTTTDRRHRVFLEHTIGLEAMARRVIRALHGNQEFRIEASGRLIEGDEPFTQPLVCRGMPPVRAFADPSATQPSDPDTWVVQTVQFEGMRRTQPIEAF